MEHYFASHFPNHSVYSCLRVGHPMMITEHDKTLVLISKRRLLSCRLQAMCSISSPPSGKTSDLRPFLGLCLCIHVLSLCQLCPGNSGSHYFPSCIGCCKPFVTADNFVSPRSLFPRCSQSIFQKSSQAPDLWKQFELFF